MSTKFGVPQEQGPRRPHLPLRSYTSNPGGGGYATGAAMSAGFASAAGVSAPSVATQRIGVPGPGKLRRLPPAYVLVASTVQGSASGASMSVGFAGGLSYNQQMGLEYQPGPGASEPFHPIQFSPRRGGFTVPLTYGYANGAAGTTGYASAAGTGFVNGLAVSMTVGYAAGVATAAGVAAGANAVSMTAGFGLAGGKLPANAVASSMSAGYAGLALTINGSAVSVTGTTGSAALSGTGSINALAASMTTGYSNLQVQAAAAGATAVSGTSGHALLTAAGPLFATGASGTTGFIGPLTGTLSASALAAVMSVGYASLSESITAAGALAVSMTSGYAFAVASSVEFGHATVVVTPQTDVPVAQVTIIEDSACFVTATYYDVNGNPMRPVSVQYRMDDVASDTNVIPWTTLIPGAFNQVTIPPANNVLINQAVTSEDKQILFQITDGLGNVFEADVVYAVKKVAGLS